jgi:DNA mismatch repair protein MutS
MMAQYRRIKGELPRDALLLFRLGDFYEMFFEDAQTGAQLLNVALTKRGVVPMCGIPFHAMNGYIGRLLRAGRKVAICEQTEEAKPGQLVNREVTQILSPGTHFDERMLTAERNNYLAAVCKGGKFFGLALVDLTTGEFRTTECDGDGALLTELDRLRPAEVVVPADAVELQTLVRGVCGVLQPYDDWVFAAETAVFTVREHFKVATLDGFGLKNRAAAIGAAGAVIHYLSQHLRRDLTHLTGCSFYETAQFLKLDSTTLRHLEVIEPLHRDAPRNSTLCGALGRTVTPMGARELRNWLSQPLASVVEIRRRQDAVQSFLANGDALAGFRAQLGAVKDLERTIGRLSLGSGNARDLLALRLGLEQVPLLKRLGAEIAAMALHEGGALIETPAPAHAPALLDELFGALVDLPHVSELIARAIVDEPPLAVKEGGLIRDGFDEALDELKRAQREGKDWIAKLQQQEIERTGISSLKVRFTSVFGYFIEVTKSNLEKVPVDYVRKQTIANGERFITPGLKEMERKILGAEERGTKLEYELFLKVREEVLGHLRAIQQTARALAALDVLAAFAETARLFDYRRPEVGDEGMLRITDGRHPVLEQQLVEERFVPNDTLLASGTEGPAEVDSRNRAAPSAPPQIGLITGPNMAGKSTYIRQVAVLALLAHTGSFLPAKEARVDLIDRIFTRIGASDDLSRGQSTFMVEMSETANILNNATARSLVILDEIGRGTSTFDGLSLAWSIVEHLHNQAGAKTLFATHYHELTELAGRLPRLKNFNVAVREWNDQVVFLRKIVEGGTDKSYGIQVARLAGVPRSVVERAKVILRNLEESELTPEGNVRQPARHRAEREKLRQIESSPQMDLFGS